MSIVTCSRQATPQEMAVEIDRRGRAIERLESEVQQLRAALEFYSIRTSYVSRTGMESPISRDGFGDRARTALIDHIGKIAPASDQLAAARAEALGEAGAIEPESDLTGPPDGAFQEGYEVGFTDCLVRFRNRIRALISPREETPTAATIAEKVHARLAVTASKEGRTDHIGTYNHGMAEAFREVLAMLDEIDAPPATLGDANG